MRISWRLSAACVALALTACGKSSEQQAQPGTRIAVSVSGLLGNSLLSLCNSASRETLSLTGNGTFAFSSYLPFGLAYSASVSSQPFGYTCSASSDSGNAHAGSVVSVVCTAASQAAADYTAAQVELAQLLLQPASNSWGGSVSYPTKLAANRAALVRAFIYGKASAQTMPEIRLYALASANGGWKVQEDLGAMTCPRTATYPAPSSWIYSYTIGDACYATLPAASVVSGRSLAVTVGTTPIVQIALPISSQNSLQLVAVPLLVSGQLATVPSNVASVILSRLPFASVSVSTHSALVLSSGYSTNLSGSNNWSNALTKLETLRQSEGTGAHYFGFVPESNFTSGTVGLGYRNSCVSACSDYFSAIGFHFSDSNSYYKDSILKDGLSATSSTLVHELGHTLSLYHAPCGNPASVDPDWPTLYSGARLPDWALYDSSAAALYQPSSLSYDYDIMAYCNGAWFSDYSLARIQSFMSSFSSLASSSTFGARVVSSANQVSASLAAQPVLLVSGSLGADGTVTLAPMQSASGLSVTPSDGSYALRLTLADGSQVRQAFEPVAMDHDANARHFFLRLAHPGVIAAVEILHGESVLFTQQSTNALTLAAQSRALASGIGGAGNVQFAEADGQLDITWDATSAPYLNLVHIDASGQRRALLLSAEGGSTSVALDGIPAGGAWEVSLSDGLNATLSLLAR